jgi:hypothetical protein
MFAAAEFADERAYYRGAIGATVGTAETAPSKRPTRDWTAGLIVYDISQPAMPRQIGFLPAGLSFAIASSRGGIAAEKSHFGEASCQMSFEKSCRYLS